MIATKTLKQQILNLIEDSEKKLSPSAIENILSSELHIQRKAIRTALTGLVSDAELEYTYIFGSSYVEKSFSRPVKISSSVVVKPYNMTYPADDADFSPNIIIDIFPGASFGSGEHPTTRLSVQGIEYALKDRNLISDFKGSTMLDIGTGSGILAIAALKFGIQTGIGLDTDPCSVSEAKKNAQINDLAGRLRISDASASMDGSFSLITANLRFPDIMKLFPVIADNAGANAPVILSGIRPEEKKSVLARYTTDGFQCLMTSEEKNWSCLVLQKKGIQ